MKDYHAAHAAALEKANQSGLDVGLWRDGFGDWQTRYLPKPENRFGHDAQVEVVRPSKPVAGAVPRPELFGV